MSNDHVNPTILAALAAVVSLAKPEPKPAPVKPSYVQQCPACWNSERGSSGCIQCGGRGRISTNGGEA